MLLRWACCAGHAVLGVCCASLPHACMRSQSADTNPPLCHAPPHCVPPAFNPPGAATALPLSHKTPHSPHSTWSSSAHPVCDLQADAAVQCHHAPPRGAAGGRCPHLARAHHRGRDWRGERGHQAGEIVLALLCCWNLPGWGQAQQGASEGVGPAGSAVGAYPGWKDRCWNLRGRGHTPANFLPGRGPALPASDAERKLGRPAGARCACCTLPTRAASSVKVVERQTGASPALSAAHAEPCCACCPRCARRWWRC